MFYNLESISNSPVWQPDLNFIICLQLPEKTEPALADKEIIMAALNIKSMNFGSNFLVGNIDDEKGILNDNRF